MKRPIFLFMSFFLLLFMPCICFFGGCTSSDSDLQCINLDECEIGDEIPVHPDCEFVYMLSNSEGVVIDKFTATLSQANILNFGDTIDSTYAPYTIEISAHGITSAGLIGEKIEFDYKKSPEESSQTYSILSTVTEEGEIIWNGSFRTYGNYIFGIYFQRLYQSIYW